MHKGHQYYAKNCKTKTELDHICHSQTIQSADKLCYKMETQSNKKIRGQITEEMGGRQEKCNCCSCLKKNSICCYKYSNTQKIFSEDSIKHMEFCETVMEKDNFVN